MSCAQPSPATASWQHALREAITSVAELRALGLLPASLSAAENERLSRHQIRIPRALAARFDRADLGRCPLYRQAVPWSGEDDPDALPPTATAHSQALYGRPLPWQVDAIGDRARLAAPRLTHRYRGRALLHVTHACALYCRYCFRKEGLNEREPALYGGPLAEAIGYLCRQPDIEEVVLTGGDPMTMPNGAWRRLLAALDSVPHLRVVRVHTRLPAILPERFEPELAEILGAARVRVTVACHVNHPAEWTEAAAQGLDCLRRRGIGLLHQAVLLRGVNDDADTLVRLWQDAYALGAIPFSLHHPDLSPHTWGYRLSIDRGRALMAAVAGRVAGPALPRYVLDVPFGQGKVDLMGHAAVPLGAAVTERGVRSQLWRVALPDTREGAASPTRTARYLDVSPAMPSDANSVARISPT